MTRGPAEPERITPPRLGEGAGADLFTRLPIIGRRLPPPGSPRMIALTAASILALVGVAWLFRSAGGILLLGGIVGVLVVAGVASAQTALRPIAALGRAACPLGLAVLVLIAAGTVQSPPLLQLAVGLAGLLVGWYGLIEREWDAPDNPLRDQDATAAQSLRQGLAQVAQVALLPVVLAAALVFAAIPLLDVLEQTSQISTVLFVLAVLLLAFAVVLRLIGYASSRLRAVVTVALALALARLGMEAGLFPGHDTLADAVPWLTADLLLLVAGVSLIVVALAEVATTAVLGRDAAEGSVSGWRTRVAVQLETPVVRRSITDRLGAYGLVASALAALALLLAVVAATTAGGAKEQFDRATLEPIRPDTPARAPGQVADDLELARMYSPVLVFTEDQRWSPVKVDAYLAAAKIKDWEGRVYAAPAVDKLPRECPGIVPKPCYSLTIECESASDDCAMGRDATVGEARQDEAVYVRVERRDERERRTRFDAGSPNPFDDVGPYGRRTRFLVQYWYFYPYDEWVAPVLGGQFKQRHEADWEAVTIGLDDAGPVFVAYSEHCGGTWSEWHDVRVANTRRPRLRPLVAVAEGSQANYRVAEDRRAPDWGKCAGVPADTLTLVSYASNIRDRTDSKWSWTPADHLLVTSETPPMSFLGHWAPYSRTTLENFRKGQALGRDQRGPATPTLQSLWREPMRTIFGNANWRRE